MQKITPIKLIFTLLTCLYILPTHHAAVQTTNNLEQPETQELSLREQLLIHRMKSITYDPNSLQSYWLYALSGQPYQACFDQSKIKPKQKAQELSQAQFDESIQKLNQKRQSYNKPDLKDDDYAAMLYEARTIYCTIPDLSPFFKYILRKAKQNKSLKKKVRCVAYCHKFALIKDYSCQEVFMEKLDGPGINTQENYPFFFEIFEENIEIQKAIFKNAVSWFGNKFDSFDDLCKKYRFLESRLTNENLKDTFLKDELSKLNNYYDYNNELQLRVLIFFILQAKDTKEETKHIVQLAQNLNRLDSFKHNKGLKPFLYLLGHYRIQSDLELREILAQDPQNLLLDLIIEQGLKIYSTQVIIDPYTIIAQYLTLQHLEICETTFHKYSPCITYDNRYAVSKALLYNHVKKDNYNIAETITNYTNYHPDELSLNVCENKIGQLVKVNQSKTQTVAISDLPPSVRQNLIQTSTLLLASLSALNRP